MADAIRECFGFGYHSIVYACTGGGLFTSTNPETRRVVPEDVNGRIKLKVVYTLLEAQYESPLSQAVRNINATNSKVGSSTQNVSMRGYEIL